jgi:hypothetical protein
MLIFFVMLVVLLQTALCRQFWGARASNSGGMLKSISSAAWNYTSSWPVAFSSVCERSAEMCYKVLTIV